MAVTSDSLELPLFVTNRSEELADWCGCKKNTLMSKISKGLSGKQAGYKCIKVEIEEGELI